MRDRRTLIERQPLLGRRTDEEKISGGKGAAKACLPVARSALRAHGDGEKLN
jgi:hypothetical protein